MIRILEKQAINDLNIAIVVSRFNQAITEKLLAGALARLAELGIAADKITVAKVPGAIEIPLTAKRFALTKQFSAIICLGAVIYGETRHFDYVCQQVSQGCQQVALTHDTPIIFGVLTTDNMLQAEERVGGRKGHMGCEAVDAAIELVSVLRQIH